MNQSELSYYSDLKAKAHEELNWAIFAKNQEHIDRLSALIAVYDEKIKEAEK